jgi:hypothetical protein
VSGSITAFVSGKDELPVDSSVRSIVVNGGVRCTW